MLPEAFVERMKDILSGEFDAFIESYDKPRHYALRINTLKIDEDSFLKLSCFALLKRVSWASNAYYYDNNASGLAPGKHPYHKAGLYYIQEPSAMAPVEELQVQPGEKILDLCAAPGGKTTQIASKLKNKGLLIANEIIGSRAKILSENIERLGVANTIVTNETPQRLVECFEGYFDKILVDAPCSGEGMFRKNDEAGNEWSIQNVLMCAKRQEEILECAYHMLRPGGRIVYSTCTFSREEDEENVEKFVNKHNEFTAQMHRIWPHKNDGEGHFYAVISSKEENDISYETFPLQGYEKTLNIKEIKECIEFINKGGIKLSGTYIRFGDQIYIAPEKTPLLKGMKVVRPGLHIGTIKKNRFEPSHALALYLSQKEYENAISFAANSDEIRKYLNGETIEYETTNGWKLICADGYSIGWGKAANGIIKNHYPKGLR